MGNTLSTSKNFYRVRGLPAEPKTAYAQNGDTIVSSHDDILTRYEKAFHAIQASKQTTAELLKVTDICAELSAQKDQIIFSIANSEQKYEITLKQYRTAPEATERVEHLVLLSDLDEYLRRLAKALKAVDAMLAGRQERVLDLKIRLEDEHNEVKMACAGLHEIDRILHPKTRKF